MFNLKRNRELKRFQELSKREGIDMGSLFSSIAERNEAHILFEKLSKKSHPDNFIGNQEKMAMAEILFKEVQSNRTNLTALKKLEAKIDAL